ncbi:hypothetical protein B9Z19DRAFT_1064293 [Tuber borchii]|uniref:Uncharacterized protein n=1 Tax=Tuber borchii TaxID=42251 RepID=A0A2T6ZV87_TUBBO|nr:hypothetical protein B9Z19DRAFT_1064293 [Tuber borchii]
MPKPQNRRSTEPCMAYANPDSSTITRQPHHTTPSASILHHHHLPSSPFKREEEDPPKNCRYNKKTTMSVYGQNNDTELRERLSAYIERGGGDWDTAGDFGADPPGSPDSLFDYPGPSNIASAFAAAASSNRVRTRSLSIRPGPPGTLPETEVQVEANGDNDGWTDTDSAASRAGSVRPDVTFAAGTGRTGGNGGNGGTSRARRAAYGSGGRSVAREAPSVGLGMAGEGPMPAQSNVAVPYSCWSCGAMVSIRRKEPFVMCAACGGRIVMKVRPEQ